MLGCMRKWLRQLKSISWKKTLLVSKSHLPMLDNPPRLMLQQMQLSQISPQSKTRLPRRQTNRPRPTSQTKARNLIRHLRPKSPQSQTRQQRRQQMPLLPKARVKVRMIVIKSQVERSWRILRRNLACTMDITVAQKGINVLICMIPTISTRVPNQGVLEMLRGHQMQVLPLSLLQPALPVRSILPMPRPTL